MVSVIMEVLFLILVIIWGYAINIITIQYESTGDEEKDKISLVNCECGDSKNG